MGKGETKRPREKLPFAEEVYSMLHDLVWILTVVTIVFVFLIRIVGVDGSSMYPTLEDHDYLFLRSNGVDSTYRQGDIVVLTVPSFDEHPIVKRVIATEGQTVDIDFYAGTVYVDGQRLDEPYIFEPTFLNYSSGLTYPATVPEGCIFVMGDNRNNSTDSRYAPIGMVDTRYVMGTVFFRIFPGQNTDAHGNLTGGRDMSRIGTVK